MYFVSFYDFKIASMMVSLGLTIKSWTSAWAYMGGVTNIIRDKTAGVTKIVSIFKKKDSVNKLGLSCAKLSSC